MREQGRMWQGDQRKEEEKEEEEEEEEEQGSKL
jgi:ribosomal protein L12E/L44/L45/RPP1/RPP2